MGIKRSRSGSVSSIETAPASTTRETSAEVKIVHLDAETAVSDHPAVMRCSLPPHQPLTFASFEEYDVHYHKIHMNRCTECQRNFPDQHFLHLHIAENHDPINAAKRDRGEKTYACLIPDCDRLCSTAQKRRLHCIDKHMFPRNYDFYIVKDGIDRRSSMLRPPHRRRSSTTTSVASGLGGHRRRSSTMNSMISQPSRDSEAMHEEEHEEDVNGEEGENERELEDVQNVASPSRPTFALRGRGGFGKPRGAGRGRGRGSPLMQAPSTKAVPKAPDPVDSLASRLSALQFVPRSVGLGTGKARRDSADS